MIYFVFIISLIINIWIRFQFFEVKSLYILCRKTCCRLDTWICIKKAKEEINPGKIRSFIFLIDLKDNSLAKEIIVKMHWILIAFVQVNWMAAMSIHGQEEFVIYY